MAAVRMLLRQLGDIHQMAGTDKRIVQRVWPDDATELPILAAVLMEWQADMNSAGMHRYVYEVRSVANLVPVLLPHRSTIVQQAQGCFTCWCSLQYDQGLVEHSVCYLGLVTSCGPHVGTP
jgi:hypothetical protein